MDKDLRRLIKDLEAAGYQTRVTSKGHVQVRRGGQVIAVFAGTPSDHRSWPNSLARLKRDGYRPNR